VLGRASFFCNLETGRCEKIGKRDYRIAREGSMRNGIAANPTSLLAWFMQPMRAWSSLQRWIALAVAVAIGVGTTIAIVQLPSVFQSPDSSHYLRIAAGHTDTVMQPFASRQLGAHVAALLAHLMHADLQTGFLIEAALSLIFAMGVTCCLALRTSAPRWLLLALVLVPSWVLLVQYLVLPDLWYAALLAGLLLLLTKEQWFAAALMMFPLMLSRESTSLTLVCFLIAAWPRIDARCRLRVAATAIISAVAGSIVVNKLAAGSQPNGEHLPQAIYLFAKVPWNFLRNVAGVLPWSDANSQLCKVPVWSAPVNLPFHSSVHAVGVCGFSLIQQGLAVEGTMTNFGLLPLLVAVLWWRHRRWQGRSVLLRFALLYGGVSYVLSPVLGAGFAHLMQYAWPLFLVALPQLFDEFQDGPLTRSRMAAGFGFLVLHLTAGVISFLPWFLLMISAGLALWVAGYLLLRHWFGPTSQEPERAPV
jgi:hypothetical protein